MPSTLILPIAGRSSRFPGTRPKWMLVSPQGKLFLEEALKPVPDWRNRRVVIGALAEHLQKLGGEQAIRTALGDHPEIVVLDEVTRGPAETVEKIIEKANVTGSIFIKDCDSWFDPVDDLSGNIVCAADLRVQHNIRNVPGKSFVKMDDNLIIHGIYEKTVCANFISMGGYGFEDAAEYTDAYARITANYSESEPFVSHVIMECISNGTVFKGVITSNCEDVGTLESWCEYRKKYSVYVIDIDGVVVKNAGQYTSPLWSDPDTPLGENIESLRKLQQHGAQFVFMTARPEMYREKTEQFLRQQGLSWHAIVFGVNHATRYIINDYAPSNPYPSAVAVNLARNDTALGTFLNADR